MTDTTNDARAYGQQTPGPNPAHLERDPRVSISVTDAENPFTMAQIRGRVVERREDDAAREIIDRISRKYTGQPYPLRTDRILLLVEPEHSLAQAFG